MTPANRLLAIDVTLPSVEENLALDEALLLEAEEHSGPEVLRFWEWPQWSVVLGAGGEIHKEVDVEQCQRDGVPIFRRSSGGGTVLLGRGCLLFSLILSMDRDPELKFVNSSYRFILQKLKLALRFLGEVHLEGICDLTLKGMKFSGNAQQRKQRTILHHGTLLYDFDLSALSRYLKQPDRQPEYRQQRSHTEFVVNLETEAKPLKEELRSSWQAEEQEIELPLKRVQELVGEKFSQQEWLWRR